MRLLIIGVLALTAMVGHSAEMPKTTVARTPSSNECGSYADAMDCLDKLQDMRSLEGDSMNLLMNCTQRVRAHVFTQKAKETNDAKAKAKLLKNAKNNCESLD